MYDRVLAERLLLDRVLLTLLHGLLVQRVVDAGVGVVYGCVKVGGCLFLF